MAGWPFIVALLARLAGWVRRPTKCLERMGSSLVLGCSHCHVTRDVTHDDTRVTGLTSRVTSLRRRWCAAARVCPAAAAAQCMVAGVRGLKSRRHPRPSSVLLSERRPHPLHRVTPPRYARLVTAPHAWSHTRMIKRSRMIKRMWIPSRDWSVAPHAWSHTCTHYLMGALSHEF